MEAQNLSDKSKKKNKKPITIAAFILAISVIGATIAYFTSTATFTNIFQTGTYKVVTTEEFESPENWAPGEEIPKTITSTNEGTIPAAVRVSFTKQWYDSETNQPIADIPDNITEIIFDNTNDWIRHGDYYYYRYPLQPGQTTTSFIEGVKLSSSLNGVTCTPSNNGLTQTCQSTIDIGGNKFKLTLTKETAQYDRYKEIWNVGNILPPVITLGNGVDPSDLNVGDEVCIGAECFYYIGANGNNAKLLAKYNLNVGHNTYNDGTVGRQHALSGSEAANENEIYGNVKYANSTVLWNGANDDIYDDTYTGYPDYNAANSPDYSIAYYVENYENLLKSFGAKNVNARLIKMSELTGLGCTSSTCPTTGANSFVTDVNYWTGSSAATTEVYAVQTDGTINSTFSYQVFYGVRPLIEMPIADIVAPAPAAVKLPASKTNETLSAGDEVCFDAECFDFIKYDGNNAVLLAKYNLNIGKNKYPNSEEGIQSPFASATSGQDSYGTTKFSTLSYWNSGVAYPIDDIYNSSKTGAPKHIAGVDVDSFSVAYYVEKYKSKLQSMGVNVNGARLLKMSEANTLGCSGGTCPTTGTNAFLTRTTYWTATANSVSEISAIQNTGEVYNQMFTSSFNGVRPVITIAKSNLS